MESPASGIFSSQNIPHYYGDTARWLMLLVAAILFVTVPVFPDLLPFSPLLQIVTAVLLVVFAALTSPHKRWTVVCDALLSGIVLIAVELIAIETYAGSSGAIFLLREGIALVLLFALYYSLKTLRSMALHVLGQQGTKPGEFDGRS